MPSLRSVEFALEDGPAKDETCPNCRSEHVESYCAACGQRAGSLAVPLMEDPERVLTLFVQRLP